MNKEDQAISDFDRGFSQGYAHGYHEALKEIDIKPLYSALIKVAAELVNARVLDELWAVVEQQESMSTNYLSLHTEAISEEMRKMAIEVREVADKISVIKEGIE